MTKKFRKEKLSRKAIDELAKRNADASGKNAFPYTTITGEKVIVSPSKIMLREGIFELNYLLGQTYPYHHLQEYGSTNFPVTDLVFDKDRKPWGTPKDATALSMISMQSKAITMSKNSSGIPVILDNGVIQPVTHEEGRSIDD